MKHLAQRSHYQTHTRYLPHLVPNGSPILPGHQLSLTDLCASLQMVHQPSGAGTFRFADERSPLVDVLAVSSISKMGMASASLQATRFHRFRDHGQLQRLFSLRSLIARSCDRALVPTFSGMACKPHIEDVSSMQLECNVIPACTGRLIDRSRLDRSISQSIDRSRLIDRSISRSIDRSIDRTIDIH